MQAQREDYEARLVALAAQIERLSYMLGRYVTLNIQERRWDYPLEDEIPLDDEVDRVMDTLAYAYTEENKKRGRTTGACP